MIEDRKKVPGAELSRRLAAFRRGMEQRHPGWTIALLNHKVSMYYFTGTMQDGVFAVTPEHAVLWVRRSLERAERESEFPDIRPMKSFRSLAEVYGSRVETLYVETKTAALDWLQLVGKHITFDGVGSVNDVLQAQRAVKSPYEIEQMKHSGRIHQKSIEETAKTLLRPGISEAELSIAIYAAQVRDGAHGIARFNQPLGEDVIGISSFGASCFEKTAFDGPGGTFGTCAAVQSLGSLQNKLEPNTVVYLDLPAGYEGYHTDKSMAYYFGDLRRDKHREELAYASACCMELERRIADRLRPGAVLSDIYASLQGDIPKEFRAGFMNGGRFFGHSIGLTIDETPVIAEKSGTAVCENMVFAVEPKIAVFGAGMVGTENTYLVTADGAVSLTGAPQPMCITG